MILKRAISWNRRRRTFLNNSAMLGAGVLTRQRSFADRDQEFPVGRDKRKTKLISVLANLYDSRRNPFPLKGNMRMA